MVKPVVWWNPKCDPHFSHWVCWKSLLLFVQPCWNRGNYMREKSNFPFLLSLSFFLSLPFSFPFLFSLSLLFLFHFKFSHSLPFSALFHRKRIYRGEYNTIRIGSKMPSYPQSLAPKNPRVSNMSTVNSSSAKDKGSDWWWWMMNGENDDDWVDTDGGGGKTWRRWWWLCWFWWLLWLWMMAFEDDDDDGDDVDDFGGGRIHGDDDLKE